MDSNELINREFQFFLILFSDKNENCTNSNWINPRNQLLYNPLQNQLPQKYYHHCL